MKKINFKDSSFIVFTLIAIFYAIGNFVWWILNTPIAPAGMAFVHFCDVFEKSLLYYNAPLLTWIMKMMFFVFGKQYFDLQIIFVNYMFFIIALYFIYKIGLKLKDKETGNIAMILFAFTPGIYELSRSYGHQEYHTMCAVIVNMYCLLKTDYFKDRKWSIFYGISVGLGLLIKDEFLICFFVPWVYLVILSLIKKLEAKKIVNLSIIVVVSSLIAYCHYFRLEIINKILTEPIREIVNPFLFEHFRITTIGLSEYLLSPPIFFLFLIGLFWFIVKYKDTTNKVILLLYFFVPWAIITFMPHHKEPEYNMIILPSLILMMAFFLSKKKLINLVVVSILLLQYLAFSFVFGTGFLDQYKVSYFKKISEDLKGNCLEQKEYIEFSNELKKYENIGTIGYCFFLLGQNKDTLTTLVLNLNLNNIKTVDLAAMNYNIENIVQCDIVVFIGETSLLDMANFEYYCSPYYYMNNEKIKDEFISKKISLLENIKENVEKYFYLAESFYLQRIESSDNIVRIYKNKKL